MSDGAAESLPATRGTLLRFGCWFGLLNGALFALVGIRYLLVFGAPASSLAGAYVVLAYIAQFALLGFLPMALLSLLLVGIYPRKWLLQIAAVLFGALGLSLMVLDTTVFAQYRFHLSALTIALFDTSTWVLTATVFAALLGFQALLSGSVWRFVSARRARRGGWLAATLVLVWCGGQGIHIWADATAYTPVTSFNRCLPFYFPIKAKRRLASLGWVDPAKVEEQRLLRRADAPDSGQLQYPLEALKCEAPAPLPNIAVILVDALRPDRINDRLTPAIAAFARDALRFEDHYSGGNSSRMGFFSFFYGLPSTYWQSFYDLQRQPVLFDVLQRNDYDIAAFSAVGFGSPSQIDRTVFASVPLAARRTPGGSFDDPNTGVTALWRDWLAARADSARPYFGFIYYDPGSFAAEVETRMDGSPAELERREKAYDESMTRVDAEIATVLRSIDAADDRETLVIITSDHGYEFDELGLGYIGHASNYGKWQLRSTLLMRWPGRAPQRFTHRSAHQDVPATLLQDIFGCTNPASDYSSGSNLFAESSWDWMIAGSYTSHAIIEPEQLVVTYPGGLIELLGRDYRADPELRLNAGSLQQAMAEMRRFYR